MGKKVNTPFTISKEEKDLKLNQKGKVLWLTGLSGSGKTTLANALEYKLFNLGKLVVVLDGDELRKGLNSGLGFSTEDRNENIRRTAEVAKLIADSGFIVIVALISPTEKMRNLAKNIIGAERFVGIFIDTPLDICEQRDVKGLYKKARSGVLKDFTGIDSPFEVPQIDYIHVTTLSNNIEECYNYIIEKSLILI